MANLKTLKRRIKTAKSISQITKAMEMVAASKMRRAQKQALKSRPYAKKLYEVLASLSGKVESSSHPLLEQREIRKQTIVLLTPDKGLCGGLNTSLFRFVYQFLGGSFSQTFFVTVGKKGRAFALRNKADLLADFPGHSRGVSLENLPSLVKLISEGYRSGQFDRVTLIFADFVSTLVQKPSAKILLPLSRLSPLPEKEVVGKECLFEPGADTVLEWLLPYYLEMELYQALLESFASEQSARMVAMKNATDNALEIIESLTLSYNKVRQSAITSEIAEITASSLVVAEL